MQRLKRFKEIAEKYKELEIELDRTKGVVFDTEKGIYGSADCYRIYEFFKRIKLQDYDNFIDIGSGDGRVVLIASLFTKATGIEFDGFLVGKAIKIRDSLCIKESRARLIKGDYLQHDLSKYDFVFSNPDQGWGKLEDKMQRELKGALYVNNDIFLPERLIKGKSYWFGNIPIIKYSKRKTKKI